MNSPRAARVTARGLRQQSTLEDWLARAALAALALLLLVAVALPLWSLLSRSFENAAGAFVGLANYRAYFASPALASSIGHSLGIALVSAALTVPLAFVYAYALTRTCMPGRSALRALALIPILAPSMLPAIAFIYLFGNQGLLKPLLLGASIYGPPGIIVAEVFHCFPHALLILMATLGLADQRLYDAAVALGASPRRIFLTVTLPGAYYGIASAFFVVFALVITDFGAPKVIGGNFNVLATDIYKQVVGQQNLETGVVVLIDRTGPGEGASKGNAGAVSPGSCIPLAMPGVLGKVPKWLNDPLGPLTIRPAYFLAALPWLMRFVFAANPARVARIADAILALHARTFECYAPLLENARAADLIRHSGTLVVYESAAAFAGSRREWEMRRERGIEFRALDAAQIRDIEPALSARYVNGVLLPTHGYVSDPFRLVTMLASQFAHDGGEIKTADVRRLVPRAGAGIAIECDGATIAADRVVIAAGAWSNRVLASLGVALPLETQRGYHVTLSGPKVEPRLPVTAAEHKYYSTPMLGGLRIAGTVEFAGLDAPPDYRRARRLLEQGRQMYPALDTAHFTEWMGHRPCLPDSLPVIGPLPRHASVLLAFGHGHNGMTSAPVTGRLIADLIAGRQPFIDPFAYRPGRF